jgi:hypothetical protein
MKIDKYPCYGCTSGDPRWRSPRLGWLCLTCFSENTHPAVRVVTTDSGDDIHPGREDLPVVRGVGGSTWTLLMYEGESSEPVETLALGINIDAEEAVTEAKWILDKRSRQRSA